MNIAIAGKKGTGKDTAADFILIDFPDLIKLSLSTPLKEIVSNLFKIDILELDKLYTKEKITKLRFGLFRTIRCVKLFNNLYLETYKEKLSLRLKFKLYKNILYKRFDSYRKVLQFIGTTIARNILNESIFIDNMLIKVKNYNSKNKYVLIPDIRFKNELDPLLNLGFFTILIKRAVPYKDSHESENSLPSENEFDFIVYNNGPMMDYYNSIYKVLEIIKDVDGKYTI